MTALVTRGLGGNVPMLASAGLQGEDAAPPASSYRLVQTLAVSGVRVLNDTLAGRGLNDLRGVRRLLSA